MLGTGHRSIRLSVASGTLLAGPVKLSYRLAGCYALEHRLLALRRLARLLARRRMPAGLFPANAKARRRADILRALDALAITPSHRTVAEAVFGEPLVRRDWSGGSDYLRTRTHRLIHEARQLVDGGYLELVRRASS